MEGDQVLAPEVTRTPALPRPTAIALGTALAAALGSLDIRRHLGEERARWIVWVPVLFGGGAVVYFRFASEPSLALALGAPVAAAVIRMALGRGLAGTVVGGALVALSLGFAVAKVRTEWVRSPVLAHKMKAAEVRGYVLLVEPKGTRGQRLTISVTSIGGLGHEVTPKRARIRSMQGLAGLAPGDAIRIKATLSPPGGPALPGGYDFGRAAWYARIGAIGYSLRAPVIDAEAQPPPWPLRFSATIERMRQDIGARIVAAVPGETGGIAVSLITGERGGISQETTNDYRNSGLLHILSISGLHMVIMAGSIFASLRLIAACVPGLVLLYPIKKWSAAAALISALAYLLISGSEVATVRSFIMISIMFMAVMLDRPALAMRNVALAALAILVAMPESVLDVGFQMSFGTVVSLIATYEAVRVPWGDGDRSGALRQVAFFLGGIVASTLIASTAVAPFAAYHFHKSQQYALLANLVAIPTCNFIVMPAALATLVVMPLGLEALPLAVMARGVDIMTGTAHWVAKLPGAVFSIPAIPELSFGLLVSGGLWLALWRTRWRFWGLAGILGGLVVAPQLERPAIMAGADGTLVAVRRNDGMLAAVARTRAPFELKRWLENDGDARGAAEVTKAGGFRCDGSGCTVRAGGGLVAVVRHPSAFAEDCLRARVLVANIPAPKDCVGPEAIIDYPALKRDGTHVLYLDRAGALRVETVAASRGDRPWSGKPDSAASSSGRDGQAKRLGASRERE